MSTRESVIAKFGVNILQKSLQDKITQQNLVDSLTDVLDFSNVAYLKTSEQPTVDSTTLLYPTAIQDWLDDSEDKLKFFDLTDDDNGAGLAIGTYIVAVDNSQPTPAYSFMLIGGSGSGDFSTANGVSINSTTGAIEFGGTATENRELGLSSPDINTPTSLNIFALSNTGQRTKNIKIDNNSVRIDSNSISPDKILEVNSQFINLLSGSSDVRVSVGDELIIKPANHLSDASQTGSYLAKKNTTGETEWRPISDLSNNNENLKFVNQGTIKYVEGVLSDFSNLETILNANSGAGGLGAPPTNTAFIFGFSGEGEGEGEGETAYYIAFAENGGIHPDFANNYAFTIKTGVDVQTEAATSNTENQYQYSFDWAVTSLELSTEDSLPLDVNEEYDFSLFMTKVRNRRNDFFVNYIENVTNVSLISIFSQPNNTGTYVPAINSDLTVTLPNTEFISEQTNGVNLNNDTQSKTTYIYLNISGQQTVTFNTSTNEAIMHSPNDGALVGTFTKDLKGSGVVSVTLLRVSDNYRYVFGFEGFSTEEVGSTVATKVFNTTIDENTETFPVTLIPAVTGKVIVVKNILIKYQSPSSGNSGTIADIGYETTDTNNDVSLAQVTLDYGIGMFSGAIDTTILDYSYSGALPRINESIQLCPTNGQSGNGSGGKYSGGNNGTFTIIIEYVEI